MCDQKPLAAAACLWSWQGLKLLMVQKGPVHGWWADVAGSVKKQASTHLTYKPQSNLRHSIKGEGSMTFLTVLKVCILTS